MWGGAVFTDRAAFFAPVRGFDHNSEMAVIMLSQSQEYGDIAHPVGHFGRMGPSARPGAVCVSTLATSMQTSALNCLATEEEPSTNRCAPSRRRILLVDDQPSVRETINFLLRMDGHTITEAGNGAAALDLFMREHFDLVITDFEMPNMNGTELAARIKQVSPTQPILMITAYADRLRESDNPVDAILDKPFRIEDLRRAIAKLLF
jgi:CheY-like chemotaxis protein